MNKVYIVSVAQISAQKPFSEAWMDEPVLYKEDKVNAIDVNFREYIAPNAARRMGKLLKRALVCAHTAMKKANIEMPNAIITATGLGCIENTEIFLNAMVCDGEKLLNPTPFMQSTHNTIGSSIGIDLKCHGYNTHYSQKYVSFDCGLQDAVLQLQSGKIQTLLLNAHDEHSPVFDSILQHLNCWHFKEGYFKGETSVSMVLADQPSPQALCCVEDMLMLYKPSVSNFQTALQNLLKRNKLNIKEIDAVFVGVNGNEENDSVYFAYAEPLFTNLPLVRYKHLFGEHFTMSGMGVYAAATCLQQKRIPLHLLLLENEQKKWNQHLNQNKSIERVLFYNHSENKEHSIILLTNKK
jgi:3-oxoacyl-(acyl-carrier-protein) synthase